MLIKKQVLAMIRAMSDFFDREQLFDRIVLIDRDEAGRQQLKTGRRSFSRETDKKLKK